MKAKLTMRYLTQSVVFAVACLALTQSAQAEANLTIPESIFDFGYAPQKSKLTHIFWLKSSGTDSLIIDRVVPG